MNYGTVPGASRAVSSQRSQAGRGAETEATTAGGSESEDEDDDVDDDDDDDEEFLESLEDEDIENFDFHAQYFTLA